MTVIIIEISTKTVYNVSSDILETTSLDSIKSNLMMVRAKNPDNYTVRSIPEDVIPSTFYKWYYVDDLLDVYIKSEYLITLDKTQILANGIDTATLSNIPEGTEIFLNNSSIGLMDTSGIMEIKTAIPKTYVISFVKNEYVNKTITIQAI